MADVSVTAASVRKGANATTETGTAGETITAGQVVYKDAADGEYKLADCNLTLGLATAVGISLCGAGDGQPLVIQTSGDINVGGTLTAGEIYVVSASAGGIGIDSELTTGDYITVLGVADSTSNLPLHIQVSGAVT